MRTQAYSQRHLITIGEVASAIAIARGTAGVEELRWLNAQQVMDAHYNLPSCAPSSRRTSSQAAWASQVVASRAARAMSQRPRRSWSSSR